jgi:hypothetical protein
LTLNCRPADTVTGNLTHLRQLRRTKLLLAALVVMLAEPAAAGGPEHDESGILLGGRLGLAFPVGSIGAQDPLADTYRWAVPLGLEGGYHFGRHVHLSGYLEYGFLSVNPSICPKLDCGARNVRLEALFAYRFAGGTTSGGHFVPWGGAGVGYEATHFSLGRGNQESTRTDSGLVLADLQIGLDYMVGSTTALGLVVAAPISVYLSASVDTPAGSGTYSISGRTVHLWPMISVRFLYAM